MMSNSESRKRLAANESSAGQIEPWYITHVREWRGHQTEAVMGKPARCVTCGAQDASALLTVTASERAAGELVADVDTLAGFIRNHPALPPQYLAEALVAAGFGNVAAARREVLVEIERTIQADLDDMEKHSTAIATGLYRAVRFIQMQRNGATS